VTGIPEDPTPAWLPRLLQASDSFYPTGAYAHSFGLEGMCCEGAVRDVDTLRAFLLEQVLTPLARTDLPVAIHAWNAAAHRPPDWAEFREACLLGAAVRGSREPRAAALAIGRQRLELAARLHGGPAAACLQRADAEGWPLPSCAVAAIEGLSLGAPLDAVLAAIVHGAATGMMSAAVKLLRLGQNAVHGLLVEVLRLAPQLIAQARSIRIEDAGTFNPWLDIAASRHEHADFRLFIS
jgi:urease accessory protein